MGLAFAAISNRLGSHGRSVSVDERAKRGSGGAAINNDLGASDEGLAGIGIAGFRKEAGLTVGGLYKHFNSRDDLVVEAVSSTFFKWTLPHPAGRRYPTQSCCAFSAPGGARSGKRTMATEQIRNDIELAGLLRARNDKDQETRQDRKPSWSSSTLVGAIVLARPVSDETLSREILKSVATLLKLQH